MFNVEIPLSLDPGKDDVGYHDELAQAVYSKVSKALWNSRAGKRHGKTDRGSVDQQLGADVIVNEKTVKVIRKSFDGRWKRRQNQEVI